MAVDHYRHYEPGTILTDTVSINLATYTDGSPIEIDFGGGMAAVRHVYLQTIPTGISAASSCTAFVEWKSRPDNDYWYAWGGYQQEKGGAVGTADSGLALDAAGFSLAFVPRHHTYFPSSNTNAGAVHPVVCAAVRFRLDMGGTPAGTLNVRLSALIA